MKSRELLNTYVVYRLWQPESGNTTCIYEAQRSAPLLLHLKGQMLVKEWEG